MTIITSIEQVTTDWLSATLGVDVATLETEMVDDQWGRTKWDIRVAYATTTALPTRLFLKLSERSREAQFYQAIQRIDASRLPIVPCYSAVIEGEKSHILLQNMSPTHQAHPPSHIPQTEPNCERMIDVLADVHSYWWDHPRLAIDLEALPTLENIEGWMADDAKRYREFADFLGDRIAPARRTMYEVVLAKLPEILKKRFADGRNLTLTFEDVHAGNFLYPYDPTGQVIMIDWEQWGINIATNDLAYMMGVFWSRERRNRLEIPYLRRYHERILNQGVQGYTWDDLWYDYRLAVIRHLFLPVFQQSMVGAVYNVWSDLWWNHFERICATFEDLNCMEILG